MSSSTTSFRSSGRPSASCQVSRRVCRTGRVPGGTRIQAAATEIQPFLNAGDYTATREGFGMSLADRESVQIKMGELAAEIATGRLLVMHAAWKLDQGDKAQKEVSMALHELWHPGSVAI